jgi:molybdenum ABC transporter molybdate-binding protein
VLSSDSLSALTSVSTASAPDKIAIANPRIAPYGLAAQQVMDSAALPAGTAKRPAARVVYGENIAQTFQFVQTGNARMGFVALSQGVGPDAAAAGRLLASAERAACAD